MSDIPLEFLMGLDEDNHDDIVKSQELPDFDPSLFGGEDD